MDDRPDELPDFPVEPPLAPPPPTGPPPGIGAPWLRAMLSIPLSLVLALLFMVVSLSFIWAPKLFEGATALDAGPTLVIMAVAYVPTCLVIALAWRFVDHLPQRALGHRGGLPRVARGLCFGTVVGVVLMGLIVGAGALVGGWQLRMAPLADVLRHQLLLFPSLLVAAYYEELLMRGYVLQNLGRRSMAFGLIASSVLFSLLHLLNPHAMDGGLTGFALTTGNITLAGVFLGTVFLRSGDLWWPTGVHVGWNWAQGMLFGMPVSGIRLPGSVMEGELAADGSWLVGGSFGPESSVLCLVLLAALSLEGIVAVRRKGRRLPLLEQHPVLEQQEPADVDPLEPPPSASPVT